jgi:hypothetical protein
MQERIPYFVNLTDEEDILKLYNVALALAGRDKKSIQVFQTREQRENWLSERITQEREKNKIIDE